jgi:LCP family protein required for cell wall assembly
MRELKEENMSVNFLDTKAPARPLAPEQTVEPKINKNHTVIYFVVGVVILMAIFACIQVFAGKGEGSVLGGELIPKKYGIFQTVKNFFFSSDKILTGASSDRINILLLGIGGPGHDGPYLSDTNMIVSIKPSTNEVALISIPRDLAVKIENYGVSRINFADAFGEQKNPGQGGEYARQVFSKIFNIDIPYYARVNFDAFEQMLDAVGGIDITVDNPFVDYSYPGENYSYQTISFASGTQHMNGVAALQYSRSRHGTNGENSDFARARRQQKVIAALKDQLLSFGTLTSPSTLQKIYESLSSNIATNLEFSQMLYLASMARDVDTSKIKHLVLDSSVNGYLYSYIADTGAFLLAPKGDNFDAINMAIANVFNTNFSSVIPTETTLALAPVKIASGTSVTSSASIPTSTYSSTSTQKLAFLENGKIEIQNGTWRAGLASRIQSRLSDQGFNIITIGNSALRPISTTTIYLINPTVSNEIVSYLVEQVKGRLATTLPEWLNDEYDNEKTTESEVGAKYNPQTDILIILGNDIME